MSLQVIGAGFGRTGTLSLKTALEMLGFAPCHHMVEVIANPSQVPFWNRAAEGATVNWDEVYGPYRATVDWPGCHFYEKLANFYPDAKVVLSVRDAERWFDSMDHTILAIAREAAQSPTAQVPAGGMTAFAGLIYEKTFNLDFSRENCIAAFERHNAEVMQRIPADRLLVYEVAQGWEPLCAHLGVPVPDMPFPQVNDRDEFRTHAAKAKEAGL
jgi:hypothetical protein